MAKFKIQKKLSQVKKGWKETLIDQLKQGKVLPIISNVVSNELIFGSHNDLVESWNEYIEYPLTEEEQALRDRLAKLPEAGDEWERYLDMAFRKTLPRTAQFQSVMSQAQAEVSQGPDFIKTTYLDFLREVLFSIVDDTLLNELRDDANFSTMSFSDTAHRLNYPPFTNDASNSLLLLASLPLPIYLTTSYHNFLEVALKRVGKEPRIEICTWNESLASLPSVFERDKAYEPSPMEPLVYHLHGLDSRPGSLVLTEDDFLDFLLAIGTDKAAIPLRVRQALADSSLMLLGFGLRSWDFRVVFRGLVKPMDNGRRPAGIVIQVKNQNEETYLEQYLRQEARFNVHWGTSQAFLEELWQGWEGQE